MKTINWGIIGAGNISATFATALNRMEDTKLVAVASRNLERAEKFAGEFQIPKAYGSYEEVVQDPDIDVIYIGTPHTEHKANAALCIENGKAVLCEKSFTLNAAETEYLIKLAKEHGVFLMEAMWTKFLPATKKVREWIAEGKIGKIQTAQVDFGFQVEFDETSRLFNPSLAGGALLDVGVYVISYAMHIINELPEQVLSTAILGISGVDEQNSMILKFNSGALAQLSSAVVAKVGENAIIIGDKGRIEIPTFWKADQATLYNAKGEMAEHFIEDKRINGYEFEAMEVNQCIREGLIESGTLPLKDTLDIMRVMDSMRANWGLKYPQEID